MKVSIPQQRRMASKLPKSRDLRAQVKRILRPATKWGRVTVWLGSLSLLLWTAIVFGAKLGGWATFTTHSLRVLRRGRGLSAGVTAL